MKKAPKGQSLIEFALLIPIMILLITVFLDLGRAVYYYIALNNAVREGTRFAIVYQGLVQDFDENDTDNIVYQEIVSKVEEYSIGLNSSNMIITCDLDDPPKNITVHGIYVFNPVTPGLELIVGSGNTISLNTEATMRLAPIANYQE